MNVQPLGAGETVGRALASYLRSVAEDADRTIAVPNSEGASLLAKTDTDGSYPTSPQAVYVMVPQEADADDTEGASASYAGDSDGKFYATNLGSSVPDQGTTVVVHMVGNRWVFRYDG